MVVPRLSDKIDEYSGRCNDPKHNSWLPETKEIKDQGSDSQNFLGKFVRFFVTLGIKILRLFRLKVLFEEYIIKG